MTTKLKEKANNSATNIKIKKPNEINTTYNAKIENTIKMDSSLKKIYLPAIQKRTMQTIPVSSITRRIRKSQSQSHLRNAYKKTNTFNPNTEKEKILLAKYSLSRINAKINDLSLNYKKLLVEKEDNLNIIKNAICSDDPTYAESISLKIQQLFICPIVQIDNFVVIILICQIHYFMLHLHISSVKSSHVLLMIGR